MFMPGHNGIHMSTGEILLWVIINVLDWREGINKHTYLLLEGQSGHVECLVCPSGCMFDSTGAEIMAFLFCVCTEPSIIRIFIRAV